MAIRFRVIACAGVVALAASALGSAAWADRPSMSRGEQFLNISEETCEARARVAYANNGWTDIAGDADWVKAHKGDFASYTTCNSIGGGQVVVNIFVAYGNADGTGNIAGTERANLQKSMEH